MSHNFVVLLEIKAGAALSDTDAHIRTMGSNGAVYGYEFIGGTDGRGNVTVQQDKARPAKIHVVLGDDDRYTIKEVLIVGDDHKQFSSAHEKKARKNPAGKKKGRALIDDKNTHVGRVKYSVFVTDDLEHCTFICDPMIKNVPS